MSTNDDIDTYATVVFDIPSHPLVQDEGHDEAQDKDYIITPAVHRRHDARFARQIDKIKQQMLFFEDVTLDDVNIDEDYLIALTVNSTSRTIVQDIKGVEPSKIGAKVLRQICVILELQSYNGKRKAVLMLDMIGQRKKNQHLELKMYSSDFEEMPAATTDDGEKQPKQRKGTRPREVQEDGPLYRLVLTFFLQKHGPLATQIRTNPSAAQLESNKFLHEQVYNILSASYNDKDEPNISSMNMDEDTYTAAGLTKSALSQFDRMTGALFSQTRDFINKQYKLAYEKSKRSGHHRDFACYCTGTPWVIMYHKHLIDTGNSTLQNLVVADLDKDVKRGFISDTPTQKRKTSGTPRSIASSVSTSCGKPPTPKLPLDHFVKLAEERYAKLAALNQLKTKNVGLKMEGNALSLYSNYREMLSQEQKRLKDLGFEEDYRSDGSETIEILTAMAVCRDQMKAARASISSIATEEQKPAAVIMNERNRTSSTTSSSDVVFEECSLDDGEEENRRNALFQV